MSLPSGYKRLEYIESTGTQYIDTLVNIEANKPITLRVVCDCSFNNAGVGNGVGTTIPGNIFYFGTYNGAYCYGLGKVDGVTSVAADTERRIHDLDAVGKKLTISGKLSLTGLSFATPTASRTFWLPQWGQGIKLYSCQIYDNGTLIRDYIPCQTTTGEIGLWDDINSVFYGNAGTGTFTAGTVLAIAADASEITELEYIQSSGTQYVNTGVVVSKNLEIKLRFMLTSTTGFGIVGYMQSVSSGTNRFAVFQYDGAWYFDFGNDSTGRISGGSFSSNTFYDVTIGNRYIKDNASESNIISGSVISDVKNSNFISILCETECGIGKIYSCKIYDNGALIRDYIAAKLSDGTVGLYDKLHGLLYINMGTGTFAAGPEVPKAPPTPSGFTSGRLTDTTVHLNWTASDGATGYKLYKNGALLNTLTDTSYTDTVQVFSSTVYAVTAYNDDGESAAATLTYYAAPENLILYLVTDRTDADVDAGNEKGTYKASDLNRVGAAMNYVADRLRSAGYDPHISPKTDWKDEDWVTPASQAVYLGDLAELRKQFAMMKSTPEVPPRILATGINTNDGLTYTWANDIERILEDVDALITNIMAGWFYSGELYAGEV